LASGLKLRIYKELKINNERRNNLINKLGNKLETHFSNEEVQTGNKYMKKYSTSSFRNEMQIKTKLKLHLHLIQNGIHQ
jgi:hypothetical protein